MLRFALTSCKTQLCELRLEKTQNRDRSKELTRYVNVRGEDVDSVTNASSTEFMVVLSDAIEMSGKFSIHGEWVNKPSPPTRHYSGKRR